MQDTVILDIYIPLSFTQLVFDSCGLLGIIPPKERTELHIFSKNFSSIFSLAVNCHLKRGELCHRRESRGQELWPRSWGAMPARRTEEDGSLEKLELE